MRQIVVRDAWRGDLLRLDLTDEATEKQAIAVAEAMLEGMGKPYWLLSDGALRGTVTYDWFNGASHIGTWSIEPANQEQGA